MDSHCVRREATVPTYLGCLKRQGMTGTGAVRAVGAVPANGPGEGTDRRTDGGPLMVQVQKPSEGGSHHVGGRLQHRSTVICMAAGSGTECELQSRQI